MTAIDDPTSDTSVDSVNGMPWAPAEDAPAILPSVCISPVKLVGAPPK